LCACASQTDAISHPIPDKKKDDEPMPIFDLSSIKETQDGSGAAYLPDWLISYFKGGIAEVEELDSFQNRYVFIGKNRGSNFTALNKWAGNYTVIQDFPLNVAVRIEKRLNSQATSYPDDEYGEFYEAFVKKAFNAEYPDTVKEQSYWIKTTADLRFNAAGQPQGTAALSDIYEFYVFISMEKSKMQSIIRTMMSDTLATVTTTRAQNAAINRLRQFFFEGF
jgi:hypothetical protein